MAAQKGGGSKLKRSQTVGVRLDPKLRYLAELAARKQRRTLSSYIEWAIEHSLKTIILTDKTQGDNDACLNILGNDLWDVDESDRVVLLALHCPDLLSFDEQVQWKVICEARDKDYKLAFWMERNGSDRGKIFQSEIRRCWDDIKKYASGELSEEEFQTAMEIPF